MSDNLLIYFDITKTFCNFAPDFKNNKRRQNAVAQVRR